MKSKFVKGIWIGLLDDYGFVVFDPTVRNIFTHTAENSLVSLWLQNTKSISQFDVAVTRPILRKNASRVTDFDRQRIATIYWAWKCNTSGATGHTQFAYESAQEENRHELAMLALEDEEWLVRLRAIQLGENPNQ